MKKSLGFAAAVLTGLTFQAVANAQIVIGPPATGKSEQAEDQKKEVKKYSAEELEALRKQLDSNSSAERDEASRKLVEAGQQAIEALTKAAEGSSFEVSNRGFEGLKQLYHKGKDAKTKEAAKKALEKISKSENARLSRRATEALKPLKEEAPEGEQQEGQVLRIGGQVLRIQGGFRILPQGGGQPNEQKQTLEVKEKGKKITLTKDKKGLTVKIVEKVDGKEVKKVYRGKDLKDLKKKSPEAAKLFEKHGKKLEEQKAEETGEVEMQIVPGNFQFQ